MKRAMLLLGVVLVSGCAAAKPAVVKDDVTKKWGLVKPAPGSEGWGEKINGNWDKVEGLLMSAESHIMKLNQRVEKLEKAGVVVEAKAGAVAEPVTPSPAPAIPAPAVVEPAPVAPAAEVSK